jgi:hypothetical protein
MREFIGQRRAVPAAGIEGPDLDLGMAGQQANQLGDGIAAGADDGRSNGGAHRL